jgi:protein TonB
VPTPEAPARSERSQLSWVALGVSRAAAHRARRQRARERIHARVAHPIDTPRLLPDPLERRASALRSTLTIARLLVIAALLHGLILSVVFVANQVLASQRRTLPPERLKVRIVETRRPPPPPPVEEPAPPPRVVDQAPARQEPKPRPRPAQAPPPDLVAPPPPAETKPPPARRVVGLSLESTVEGAQGPAFAVGSTRMGETGPAAVDPGRAAREPEPERSNRVSTRFEQADTPIVAPRRLAPSEPVYPPLLRERGVEADVVVVVSIGADGRVKHVEIAGPAPEPAFNDAALTAAKRELYAPATRGGEPVPFTQRYTIRFRIHD